MLEFVFLLYRKMSKELVILLIEDNYLYSILWVQVLTHDIIQNYIFH